MLETNSNHTPARKPSVNSLGFSLHLKTRPRKRARTLKKGENLQHSDRCFVCGNLADAVRRCGSRYSPVCWECLEAHRQPQEQHFAESVEYFIKGVENSDDVLDLVRTILNDLQNEVGVFSSDRRVVRAFLLATLNELKKPAVATAPWRSRERVNEMLGHLTEILNGCSDMRLAEIDRRYNPEEPIENATIHGLREKLEMLERLPENEAVALQLESEIARLERENEIVTEWPDVIGGGDEQN